MMFPHAFTAPATDVPGPRSVSSDAALPLESMRLEVDARGGLARVKVEQRFRNHGTTPLAVTYVFPLPADGAVSGYAFQIGGRRIAGEIARREDARERFERAIIEGHTAALLEQERSSLFTQELGNIPPGAEVVAELTVDQPLRWLAEGAWEWRFPTAAAPRYLGAAGRVRDAQRVAIDVADGPLSATATLGMRVGDRATKGAPMSPSHRIHSQPSHGAAGEAAWEVTLADDPGAALDRDVVVRWDAADAKVGLSLSVGNPEPGAFHEGARYGVLTVVPPLADRSAPALARDLIVLLDTSGSMGGQPLDQARRIVTALIDTLGDADQLELVAFSSEARRWKPSPVFATYANKHEALGWLGSLRASGGTEMREGIYEAIRGLRAESQRQVVLVTDGLIGFEAEVVATIGRSLPPSSRLHTIGVGSSVNRSLTGPAARAGRGVEVIVGLGEDVEPAARRIVARTAVPVLVDLEVSGTALVEHAPARLPDLFAGSPLLLGLRLRAGGGSLVVRGRTSRGVWQGVLSVPESSVAEPNVAAAAFFGREAVLDVEMQVAAWGGVTPQLDLAIERLGLGFGLATRRTSWVAVSDEPTVDPREPSRKVRVPQALPHGMSVEGLGLRSPVQAVGGRGAASFGAALAGSAQPRSRSMESARTGAPPRQYSHAPPPAARPSIASPARGMAPPPPGAPPAADRASAKKEEEEVRSMVVRQPAAPQGLVPRGAPPATSGRTVVRGRIATRTATELVVDITFDRDTDWAPPADGEVSLTGRSARARVVTERTTYAGRVAAGTTVRLVLAVAIDPTDVPLSVDLLCPSGWIIVQL